ncbi:MAG: NADH-quinone oxidoreductase subunit C [Rhodovarius sp.]|nr:NADH-quinone oxidoreductase subunit C [Rhodovarius sp.]
MAALNGAGLIRACPRAGLGHRLDAATWAELARRPDPPLLALWAEPTTIHAVFLDRGAPLPVSLPLSERRFPALSPMRPGAAAAERMIHDLWGIEAWGGQDGRPLLDHGRWELINPLSPRPLRRDAPGPVPEFRAPPAAGAHRLEYGPIPAAIDGPEHRQLILRGEEVLAAEFRPGYAHRGMLGLMLGKSPRAAARYPARLAADSTLAHSLAFALAAEGAVGVTLPPRALALRALLAELERAASHLWHLSRLAQAAQAPLPAEEALLLREVLLEAAAAAFGRRLPMDLVLPGGLAEDITPEGPARLQGALAAIGREWPRLRRQAERLARRLAGLGRIDPRLVAQVAAGGPPARAAGIDQDLRRLPGYAPYEELEPRCLIEAGGDAAARCALWLAEADDSWRMIRLLVDALPAGPWQVALPAAAGEGLGLVEGPRGPCLAWLRLDGGGLIEAAFLQDPATAQLPLLEAALTAAPLEAAEVVRASLPVPAAGMDL